MLLKVNLNKNNHHQNEYIFNLTFLDSCRCVRFICARNRPFISKQAKNWFFLRLTKYAHIFLFLHKVHIVDRDNKEVMRLYRDFKCCNLFSCRNWFAGCSKCCGNEITVESPVGTRIGI